MICIVSSTRPFDGAKFHITLDRYTYDRVLCGKDLSPGRFAIQTVSRAANYGAPKEYSMEECLKMPELCKSCKKVLEKYSRPQNCGVAKQNKNKL